MKIKAERAPAFRPVTLTITVETNQEFETLQAMCRLDQAIPNQLVVEAGSDDAYDVAQRFLTNLRIVLSF